MDMKKVLQIILILSSITTIVAQPFPDRHTTNAFDGWISCEKSVNPNNAHGNSHWIMYDLGQSYSLYDLTFWNMNHPDYSNDGLKNVIVEHSVNGSTWVLVDTVTIPQASTSGYYEGFSGPDLEGAIARYVLITALDNHGGGCYALSELRIYTQDQTQDSLELSLILCEGDGMYQNINGGLTMGGVFSGPGVTDNGDESFNFDAVTVGPGMHEIVYTHGGGILTDHVQVLPCMDGRCPDCADCVLDDTISVDMNPIPTDQYKAYKISSMGKVTANEDVRFTGNESVLLEPGFEVLSPGSFIAEMRQCDINTLLNPGFEAGTADWTLSTQSSATASLSIDSSNPFEESQSAVVDVTNATGTDWHVQFLQGGQTIENAKTYRVTFAARAVGASIMGMLVQLHSSPWTVYGSQTYNITPYWEVYDLTFIADETVNGNIKIAAMYGEQAGTFYIDKIKFVEIN